MPTEISKLLVRNDISSQIIYLAKPGLLLVDLLPRLVDIENWSDD